MIVILIEIAYNRIKDGGVRMDAPNKEEIYTIDDIYALPEGDRRTPGSVRGIPRKGYVYSTF